MDTGTDPSAQTQSTGKREAHRLSATDRPLSSEPADTGSPALHRPRRDSISSLSSDAGSAMSDRPPLDLYTEEGELSEDPDQTVADQDQPVSEEQNYRETMQGIRSYMGWSQIPEVDNPTASSDDNPFAGPKTVVLGKVSVKIPTEEWLCRKLGKLNLTLAEGYPSHGSEAGGLAKDVFLRPARSQTKWYGLHTDPKTDPSKVSTWCMDASKLHSSYSRIARYTGLSSTPPASRRISQETLRRWERSAREASVICNQAASFNRCLFRVQQNMKDQLKTLRAESKGKGSAKGSPAADELHYLLDFNSSITQVAAKSMEHLSEFVFITMGNLTLVRRDAYLSHLRTGIKPDTLTALRTAPLHLSTLFPDSTIKRAEEDIAQLKQKDTLGLLPVRVGTIHMNVRTRGRAPRNQGRTSQPGKQLAGSTSRKGKVALPLTPHDLPRASSRTNDNYCMAKLKTRLLAGSTPQALTRDFLTVKSPVVHTVTSTPGQSQKKDLSPGQADCHYLKCKLKSVKSVSCVTQLSCVNTASNVRNAALNLPVGARLQKFWQTWLDLGACPKVLQILREGYTLPFRNRPKLTRFPTVTSCYANPHRNSYLLEALHQLIDKNAVELVHNQMSLFYNRLFLVPKPNNKWRPILDLSKVNFFLKVEKFKMETPETIRTSLQQGEWVTSIDFKDAYFHIPIQEQSRKYLRFHVQGRTYQFKALPFGLSTAPLEFTVVAKEVKLMAIHKGIKIHQDLDDWLVRARSYQTCLQHTQILIKICQKLGWLVNLDKSELEPKQIFDFVGYQFDLKTGRVRPTLDWWQSLQGKILEILRLPAFPVRQFMSLIGLLTATEKQVHLGRLHMRPIQWHLKRHWRIPESLEKVIPIPSSLQPHLQWWLQEDNVVTGQPLHPVKHALQIFTDASKEGWGAHLNEHTARGIWSLPESKVHINYLELKAVFLALKEFQSLCTCKIVLVATCSNRQHYSAEHGSRQAIQARPDHSNRMVPPSRGFPNYMQQVAPTSHRSICHEVQQQVTSVRDTST